MGNMLLLLLTMGGISLELPPVNTPISVIVLKLAAGAMREASGDLPNVSQFELIHPTKPGKALLNLAGYVVDIKTNDYIEYSYTLGPLNRRTLIKNDKITLITTLTKVEHRLPIVITITITATETCNGTLIRGEAYGAPNYNVFKCRLVRRIARKRAPPQINAGLCAALLELKAKGVSLYHLSDTCTRKIIATPLYRK